jgi:hypothetical protein
MADGKSAEAAGDRPTGDVGTRAAAKRFELVGNVSLGRNQLFEMLRREFRAMARVDHPNLVRILGVVLADGSHSARTPTKHYSVAASHASH